MNNKLVEPWLPCRLSFCGRQLLQGAWKVTGEAATPRLGNDGWTDSLARTGHRGPPVSRPAQAEPLVDRETDRASASGPS